ncbi:CBO0543 family protein [Paenibacillus sp. P36]|uniref:CBO0543 family protein n=1 Tax=Paenibacillus sp. P36 TaxID=3342538 RepID=UPI0038B2FEA9
MPNEIEELNVKESRMEFDYWLQQDVFSFQWWVIVIVNLVVFALLLILIDRKRTLSTVLAFMTAFIIVGAVDQIGKFFDLWRYPHQLIPFTENLNAVDFFVVPSIFAYLYQRFSSWKSFLIADVVASLVISYIGEPLFVSLGMYQLMRWSYWQSFIVLVPIAILVKGFVDLTQSNVLHFNVDRELVINFNARNKKKIR